MMTILLQRIAVYATLAAVMAGCIAEKTPENTSVPAASASQGTEPSVQVIEALEAAARGESFEGDLHPETKKTGKPMSPIQVAFDVKRYALSVRVMPATRTIEGTVDVTFEALESLDTIELDLDLSGPRVRNRLAVGVDEHGRIDREAVTPRPTDLRVLEQLGGRRAIRGLEREGERRLETDAAIPIATTKTSR